MTNCINNKSDLIEDSLNFDIIAFVSENENYIKHAHDMYVSDKNEMYTYSLNYCIAHNQIKNVIRLSDLEIFNLGDFVKNKNKTLHATIHKIESFSIKRKQCNKKEYFGPERIWVKYDNDCGGNWLDELELVSFVLQTFDNHRLTVGDNVYRLVMGIDGNSNIIFNEHIYAKDFKQQKDSLYFGNHTSAQMHSSINTIKYSEQDILNACIDHLTPTQKTELGLGFFDRIIDLSKLIK